MRNPPRIALVLLASLAGLLMGGAVARGEPATTPSSSAANAGCLASPSAPSAPGNHWYYRVDRASGRHCWYQRPTIGGANDAAQSRPSTRANATRSTPAITAPANRPAPALSADRLGAARDQDRDQNAARDQDLDQNAVESAAAAPTQPYSWSTAAPPPQPPEQMTSAANDTTAPAPAVAPQSEAVAEPPQIAPTPVATIRTRVPERPAVAADDGAHIPALFGAAFALGIIVLGSIVARLGAKLIRSRRRGGVREAAPKEQPPFLHVQDTPALVPPMPREDDITRRAPPPWMTRGAPAARRNDAASSEDAAPRIPDSARALEQNVRELLHRMRSELPRMPGASPDPQPRSPQELDELLASWRGVRRRPAAR